MSVVESMIQVMEKGRETEWASYVGRLARMGRLSGIAKDEQVLHDLYVVGEITMEDVFLVESGRMSVEDIVGDTCVLLYGCILCHDTGCKSCEVDAEPPCGDPRPDPRTHPEFWTE